MVSTSAAAAEDPLASQPCGCTVRSNCGTGLREVFRRCIWLLRLQGSGCSPMDLQIKIVFGSCPSFRPPAMAPVPSGVPVPFVNHLNCTRRRNQPEPVTASEIFFRRSSILHTIRITKSHSALPDLVTCTQWCNELSRVFWDGLGFYY